MSPSEDHKSKTSPQRINCILRLHWGSFPHHSCTNLQNVTGHTGFQYFREREGVFLHFKYFARREMDNPNHCYQLPAVHRLDPMLDSLECSEDKKNSMHNSSTASNILTTHRRGHEDSIVKKLFVFRELFGPFLIITTPDFCCLNCTGVCVCEIKNASMAKKCNKRFGIYRKLENIQCVCRFDLCWPASDRVLFQSIGVEVLTWVFQVRQEGCQELSRKKLHSSSCHIESTGRTTRIIT